MWCRKIVCDALASGCCCYVVALRLSLSNNRRFLPTETLQYKFTSFIRSITSVMTFEYICFQKDVWIFELQHFLKSFFR